MSNGKGSRIRDKRISEEQWDENMSRIYGKGFGPKPNYVEDADGEAGNYSDRLPRLSEPAFIDPPPRQIFDMHNTLLTEIYNHFFRRNKNITK